MAYSPRITPAKTDDLPVFLEDEFQAVSEGIEEFRLFKLHVEPDKPYEGQLVLADGTDWDPGSGLGFYGYDGSTWRLLG